MNAFLVKSLETIDPQGVAKFDPRGMIGSIYNGDYKSIATYKKTYISSGPGGLKEDYLSFSPCKSMETIDPQGMAKCYPSGMAGTIYIEDH